MVCWFSRGGLCCIFLCFRCWRVFWCMLHTSYQFPLCLGMLRNELLCTTLSSFHKDHVKAHCLAPSQSLPHHRFPLSGCKQMLCTHEFQHMTVCSTLQRCQLWLCLSRCCCWCDMLVDALCFIYLCDDCWEILRYSKSVKLFVFFKVWIH